MMISLQLEAEIHSIKQRQFKLLENRWITQTDMFNKHIIT